MFNDFATMINAVLVFNNNGQPRLTKFYTQLVIARLILARVSVTNCRRTRPHNNLSLLKSLLWSLLGLLLPATSFLFLLY